MVKSKKPEFQHPSDKEPMSVEDYEPNSNIEEQKRIAQEEKELAEVVSRFEENVLNK